MSMWILNNALFYSKHLVCRLAWYFVSFLWYMSLLCLFLFHSPPPLFRKKNVLKIQNIIYKSTLLSFAGMKGKNLNIHTLMAIFCASKVILHLKSHLGEYRIQSLNKVNYTGTGKESCCSTFEYSRNHQRCMHVLSTLPKIYSWNN